MRQRPGLAGRRGTDDLPPDLQDRETSRAGRVWLVSERVYYRGISNPTRLDRWAAVSMSYGYHDRSVAGFQGIFQVGNVGSFPEA